MISLAAVNIEIQVNKIDNTNTTVMVLHYRKSSQALIEWIITSIWGFPKPLHKLWAVVIMHLTVNDSANQS